ncbi:ribosome maturation factor RimM [Spirochaetia bacterium]|nr:ribosome maturation factor RimM [Spirochaetia bacterium]
MTEQFVVALVGAPFGIKGFVKTKPLSGELDHLEQLETVVLRRENRETSFYIEETLRVGPSLAVKFRGIDTPEAARALSGAEMCTDRDHAAPLGTDEYYIEDLRGIPVTDTDGAVLGHITDVLEGGGGQLIELRLTSPLPGGELRLVPFRKEFFGEVDVDNASIEKRRAVLLERWILA